jgi:NADH dehydrogenase
MNKRVVIVGAGFAGLNCAKRLGKARGVEVVVIDRRNHHLFQPLLYQVATAGLSPADIAMPIRGLLSRYGNVRVVQATVTDIELREPQRPHGSQGNGNGSARGNGQLGKGQRGDGQGRPFRESGDGSLCAPSERADFADAAGVVHAGPHAFPFDYLLLAAGAQHAYFGHETWEPLAPGLKTLEQATEIRRRVLQAFERAELTSDPEERRAALTFVVVGGGPTGVELAGAIGEMSRFTLSRDFRCIDPKLTRIILLEAGPRILQSFPEDLAASAMEGLERVGVQVWTNSPVTDIDEDGVSVGEERVRARTVLWAAGVRASETGATLGVPRDRAGRVHVGPDLTIPGHPTVFVAGDQAHATGPDEKPLPGVATVALQQGRYVAQTIRDDLAGRPRKDFEYWDKGQMATIGRRRAVLQSGKLKMDGLFAWFAWLLVHIYYLSGFRNRLLVLLQWSWSYLTFARGARLIVGKEWRSYGDEGEELRTSLAPRASPNAAAPPTNP